MRSKRRGAQKPASRNGSRLYRYPPCGCRRISPPRCPSVRSFGSAGAGDLQLNVEQGEILLDRFEPLVGHAAVALGEQLLALKVLTPEGAVLEGDVSEVTLPGSEGELGVLPAHAALLTKIIPGALAYRAPEGHGVIAVGRGVAEVRDDRVIVLVERAVPAEEIDAGALDARRKQLVAEQDSGVAEERVEEIEEEIVLLDVQLRIARSGAEAAH